MITRRNLMAGTAAFAAPAVVYTDCRQSSPDIAGFAAKLRNLPGSAAYSDHRLCNALADGLDRLSTETDGRHAALEALRRGGAV